jgi:glycerol-3-phosphate dehydrogenase (NAD(P)+)
MNICVLGAGAWGTALALAFANDVGADGMARHRVSLWCWDPEQAKDMLAKRENERFLRGCPLPDNISISADFSILADADLALVVTPMAGLRNTLQQLTKLAPQMPFLWACKGLESGTGLLPHQVVSQLGASADYGVLTGPSFADEVGRGLPAAVTVASANPDFARRMAQQLGNKKLRVYASEDLIGAEVGGAVKNVLAIASGISDGLGLGHNARAALVTRGLAEITRFGVALGGKRDTFMGLTGMGDLLLTCTGDLSRNRRVGLALAKGTPLAQITEELGHVAEGVLTSREVDRRAKELGIDMPITRAVCQVLDGELGTSVLTSSIAMGLPKFTAAPFFCNGVLFLNKKHEAESTEAGQTCR